MSSSAGWRRCTSARCSRLRCSGSGAAGRIEQGSRWQRVALHFGFSAVFSAVTTAIEAPVLTALGVFPAVAPARSLGTVFSILLVNGFHGGVIRYWAVIGLQAVYRSHQNAQARERESLRLMIQSSELAAQLSAAQLSALKMQLQPHFLFNTLGAIMVAGAAAEDATRPKR